MTFKFELGVTVEHMIHDYVGVVVARTEHITGCNRYALQPSGLTKEGTPKTSYDMDEHALKQTKAKKIIIKRDAGPFKFELGVTVKHLVHGLEGVVIARAEQLTSSNEYMVQSVKPKPDGDLRKPAWFYEDMLEQTKAKQIVIPEPTVARKTGGPSEVARQRPETGRR